MSVSVKTKNFAVVLQDVKALDVQLLPKAARGMQRGLQIAAGVAQTEYLSGPRPEKLGVITGRLRGGVTVEVEVTGTNVLGKMGDNVAYAARHEFGFEGTEQVREHTRTIMELAKAKGMIGAGFKAVDSRTPLYEILSNGEKQFVGYKESSRGVAAARKGTMVFTQIVKAHSRKVNYKGRPFIRPALEKTMPVILEETQKEILRKD